MADNGKMVYDRKAGTATTPGGVVISRSTMDRTESKTRKKGRNATSMELVRELTADVEWEGITRADQKAFLSALSVCGSIVMASNLSGVRREQVYRNWIKNEVFKEHFEFAKGQPACDLLEEEAWRRAVDGVEKPVYHNGVEVNTIREYSDSLLLALLKAHMPHKYGTKVKVEASVVDDRTIPEIPKDADRRVAVLALMASLHGGEDIIDIEPAEKED